MDPNACFSDLLDALGENDLELAQEFGTYLEEWLTKGGFYPGNGKIRKTSIHAFLGYVSAQ